nr:hypothetical protein CFP56_66169 [Quercus suber]
MWLRLERHEIPERGTLMEGMMRQTAGSDTSRHSDLSGGEDKISQCIHVAGRYFASIGVFFCLAYWLACW